MINTRSVQRLRYALGLSLFLAAGCSSTGSDTQPSRSFELFTFWVNPGESGALNSLLAAFNDEYPGTTVLQTSASSPSAALSQLRTRMSAGTPPDTFQALGGADVRRWISGTEAQGALEPLDELAQAAGLLDALPRVVRTSVSQGDHLYCIPLDVIRTNVLFFNRRVLEGNQLSPPTTLAEFYQVAESLKSKDLVPLALGIKDGATATQLLLDSVLVASAGLTFRDSFLAGQENPTDPRLRAALEETSKLLDYTNLDRDALDWTAAARKVVEGSAAMTFVGDFAKAFFVTAGLKPSDDLGQIAFPGTQGIFVYLVDCFALPQGAANRRAARDFLGFIGKKPVAEAFIVRKGTTPARFDISDSVLDPLGQQTLDDFHSGQLTLGRSGIIANPALLAELDAALRQFAIDRNLDAVVNLFDNRYDQF